ncbi:MAG: tetratricopeptide repeat protein [Bryobacteraceae bacterium]
MARWILVTLAAAGLALGSPQQKQGPPPAQPQEQEPPEEDENLKPQVYGFNPLQAANEIKVGDFYWKKGSYKAAMQRYRESTRWNPGNAEAWLKLGEAHEKLKDPKAAREAYAKYLELAPDAKNASQIRKKLAARK